MTVLTTIPNGALQKDIRDTINAMLADVAVLKAGTVTPAPIPVSITGTPPITGTVGQSYSFTPATANGSGTKTFALTSGTLLGGLSFSTTTGAISGTPNVAGTMTGIVIRVTDSTGSASTTATNVTIALSTAPAATNGIVNDGDSITEGPNYIPVRPPRPEMLAAITGLQTTNLGVSGRKLEAMDSTFGSRNVAGLFNASSRNTVSLLGGINDLTDTTTVDQLRDWITSYVGKARAAGFRVNLGTILPNGNGSSATNTIRQNFNAWLRSNYQTIGAQTLADYDAIAEAALTGSLLWYVDKLHPTPRLLAKMALVEAQAMGVAITQYNPNPRMTDTANIGGYIGYYYNTNYAIQPQDISQLSYVDGKLRLTATDTRWFPEAHIEINGLVVNQNYRLSYDIPALAVGGSDLGTRARVAENVGDDFSKTPAFPSSADGTVGSKVYDFTATKTSMAITLQLYTNMPGYGDFDNITLMAR